MKSRGRLAWPLVAVAAIAGGLIWFAFTLADDGEVGDQNHTMRDVELIDGHFDGDPVTVTATLTARSNGCVTSVVDGTARLTFWPEGTTIEEDEDDPTASIVTLDDGTTLRAHATDGDTFTATVIEDSAPDEPMLSIDGTPYERIAYYLSSCHLEGPAIAIPEQGSITVE
ncbi:hypothetical protein [Demequina gelatinilytica]|uniref:hypothetical protein n=1 Tax=Demequina gelatinilytica TaxID=1638980 RepID=UPI0012E07163|nr:hypothetical protein [Demequina gelatinilytica]